LIVLGAFVAGARDFSFDGYGYTVVFIANITTAIYLATIAHVGSTLTLFFFGVLFWKSLNGMFSSLAWHPS
jgi:solute carrier family 35 protein